MASEKLDRTDRVVMYPKSYGQKTIRELSDRPFIYLRGDVEPSEDELRLAKDIGLAHGPLIGVPSAPLVRSYVLAGHGVAFGVTLYPEVSQKLVRSIRVDTLDQKLRDVFAHDDIRAYLLLKEGQELSEPAAELVRRVRALFDTQKNPQP